MLRGPGDVDLLLEPWIYERVPRLGPLAEEDDETMIHYTVTEQCAFRCKGCINALTAGKGDLDRTTFVPAPRRGENLERDIKGMAHLIRSSGKSRAVVVFYGGEPMLRLDRMDQVYRGLKVLVDGSMPVAFAVITSGHYLERLVKRFPELATEIALTAVSVDGTETQHDTMREGTSLREIRRQLSLFHKVRKGEVLIWSTMRPGMSLLDCYRSFEELRSRGDAEHFFWHWDEADRPIRDLHAYMEAYCRDLNLVMDGYLESLGRGALPSIVHVNELLLYMLTRKRRGTTACGVEHMGDFDIIGDGKVHGCADLPEAMSIGRITDEGEVIFSPDAPERLARATHYKTDLGCSECGVEPYCGGRCPVQANTGGLERARQYCFMMREHVRVVKGYVGRIVESMTDHGLGLKELQASARIAGYADVTP
jgi:uncharacterized protein